jgi:hypothetical protein
MSLKNQITALAEEFSVGILAAIRAASLEEILNEGGGRASAPRAAVVAKDGPAPARRAKRSSSMGKGGRLARRSPEQIAEVVETIVGALKKTKTGMRSEQLQKLLKLDKKEISGPLNEALAGKKITKKGQRRATTYFAR